MTRQIHTPPANSEFYRLSSTDFDQTESHTGNCPQQRTKLCHRASRLTNQSFWQITERGTPTTQAQNQIRKANTIAQGQKKSLFKISNRTLARLSFGLSILYGLAGIGIGVLAAASLLTPFPFGLVIGAIIFLLAAQTMHAGCWYMFDKLARKDQKIERHQKRLAQKQLAQASSTDQTMKVRDYYDKLEQQYEQSLTIFSESNEPSQQGNYPFSAQLNRRKYHRPIAKPLVARQLENNPALRLIDWTKMPKNNYHDILVSKLSQNAKPS